jgi:hypothetical protein
MLNKPKPRPKAHYHELCSLAEKQKTSNEKIGKPKTQGAQKQKISDEKRGNPKT